MRRPFARLSLLPLEDRLTPSGYSPTITALLPPVTLSRVSVTAEGTEGLAGAGSVQPALSADGRYVAFNSGAPDLVPGAFSGGVFRRDLFTGQMVRASSATNGTAGNGNSSGADISADGRYVVFESDGTNLVAGDTNGEADIFRKDLLTGELLRVSTTAGGAQANGRSQEPQVSADGRYVVFHSTATNLTATDTNGAHDIFLKDLQTGQVVLVSAAADGIQGNDASNYPVISADGRYVVFETTSSNFVAGDTNNTYDIFRKDLQTGQIVRANVTSAGALVGQGHSAAISADGRYVAFEAGLGVYRKDLLTGQVALASSAADGTAGNNTSNNPSISADGRYVAFESVALNLVPTSVSTWANLFRKDLQTGTIIRIDVAADGALANGIGGWTTLSPDGQTVAFHHDASNLVPGDTNYSNDVFVWGPVGAAVVTAAENQTAVATVTATDPDPGTTLTFSISGGTDAAKFAIDPATGVLTFLAAPDFEAPTDANGDSVYVVTVQVSDGTLSDDQSIRVTVTNANEAPAITSGGTVNAAENQTAVTTVTATDPDAGTTLTFSISGGADAAKFAINGTTGVLTFVAAPNFEAPTDANGDNVYEVTVRVSDGTLTDSRTVNVTVTNVNEAPAITSSGAASVLERTTAVQTVTVADPDAGTAFAYAIVGGADAAKFALDAATGALTFVTAPDFNIPTDTNTDNVYAVTVQVSDGALTATRTVNVTVLPNPILPFADPFHPTANGTLTANWVIRGGVFSVAGGVATGTAVGANVAVVRNIAAADVVVSAVAQSQAGATLVASQLVARYQAAGDTFYLGMLNAYNNTRAGTFYLAEIWKVVGGVPTPLNANANPIAPASAAGKTMRFEVLGASLRFYLNDTLWAFAQDASIAAAGTVGLRLGKGARVDDFAAAARPPVAPTLPFADAFNAANPQGSLATTWQERSGFFRVTAGTPRAVGGSASLPNLATLNGVGAANVTVAADFLFTAANQTAQLVGRYAGTNGTGDRNYYAATLTPLANGDALLRLLRNVNGAVTELGRKTLSGMFAGGFATPVGGFQFQLLGTQLSVRIGATTHLTATDGTFAAGSVGLRTSQGVGADDFTAT